MEQEVASAGGEDQFFDFNIIDRSKSNFRKAKKNWFSESWFNRLLKNWIKIDITSVSAYCRTFWHIPNSNIPATSQNTVAISLLADNAVFPFLVLRCLSSPMPCFVVLIRCVMIHPHFIPHHYSVQEQSPLVFKPHQKIESVAKRYFLCSSERRRGTHRLSTFR